MDPMDPQVAKLGIQAAHKKIGLAREAPKVVLVFWLDRQKGSLTMFKYV